MANRTRTLFLGLLIALLPAFLAAQPDAEQLLEQASEARSSDPARFVELLDQLLDRRNELAADQVDFLDYLVGYRAAFEGRFDEAAQIYRQVFERSGDPTLRFRVGYSLANVHSITRNWTAGLLQLNVTMAELPAIEDSAVRQSGLLAAAIFYNQLEQFDLGLRYIEQAFGSDITQRNLCFATQLRIEALLHLDRLQPASAEVHRGIADCEAANELVVANTIRNNVAQIQVDRAQHNAAIDALRPHLDGIVATGYKRLMAESYALLSQAYLGLGEWQIAADHAQQAIEHAKGFPISEPTVQAFWTLKEFHRQDRNFEQALLYEASHSEAKTGFQDDRARKQLAIELANHEVEKKNQQIELLSEQNRVLELREDLAREVATKNRLVIYLAGVLALSLAGWIYLQRRAQRKLRRLAECDSLTGLSNRRHFSESAAHLLSYCEGRNQDASFIMFDLDHFKQINDTYGHAAGDWVLQEVAQAIKKLTRQNDLIGRVGGEEFALVLPSCDIDRGLDFAAKYREAIEAIDCSQLPGDAHISASLGVTSCKLSGYALQDLMRDCDSALYEAKHRGRNQIIQFEAAMRDKQTQVPEHDLAAVPQ